MFIFTFSSLVLTVFLRINISLSDAIAQAVPEETNKFAPSNKLKSRKKLRFQNVVIGYFGQFKYL